MSDVACAARVHHIRQWRDLYPHFQVDDWGENGVFEMVDLLLSEIDRRDAILRDLIDPDDCSYDHHGYCQAHFWQTDEDVCPHKRAKELLGDE